MASLELPGPHRGADGAAGVRTATLARGHRGAAILWRWFWDSPWDVGGLLGFGLFVWLLRRVRGVRGHALVIPRVTHQPGLVHLWCQSPPLRGAARR